MKYSPSKIYTYVICSFIISFIVWTIISGTAFQALGLKKCYPQNLYMDGNVIGNMIVCDTNIIGSFLKYIISFGCSIKTTIFLYKHKDEFFDYFDGYWFVSLRIQGFNGNLSHFLTLGCSGSKYDATAGEETDPKQSLIFGR